MVQGSCSNHSECNPVLPCHLWWEKRAVIQSSLDQRVDIIQAGTRNSTVSVRHEWNWSLPCISYCWWSFSSTISHLLTFLQAVTLLACFLDASLWRPAVVLYTILFRYCTVRFKMCSLFWVLICSLFMWNHFCEKYYKLIALSYIDNCVSWGPRLCQTYEKIGLTNVL